MVATIDSCSRVPCRQTATSSQPSSSAIQPGSATTPASTIASTPPSSSIVPVEGDAVVGRSVRSVTDSFGEGLVGRDRDFPRSLEEEVVSQETRRQVASRIAKRTWMFGIETESSAARTSRKKRPG
ncbi:MAG: hypothetical protein VX012_10785 [Planctomycetota bacterium]|nr:hypothetical protein [Planctomycetota bacterium]